MANFVCADPNKNLAEINGWVIKNCRISDVKNAAICNGAVKDYCKGLAGLEHRTKGIWLDWSDQNTKVNGNIISDFQSEGFKLEIRHGPLITSKYEKRIECI